MRDIPPGFLAAETSDPKENIKSALSDIKDVSKKFSDFESRQSSAESSSYDSTTENSENSDFKTMNSKKRGYRKKRKASLTPGKEHFLKKQNKSSSPSEKF